MIKYQVKLDIVLTARKKERKDYEKDLIKNSWKKMVYHTVSSIGRKENLTLDLESGNLIGSGEMTTIAASWQVFSKRNRQGAT